MNRNFVTNATSINYRLITPTLSSVSIGGYLRTEQRGRARYVFTM